MRYAATCGLKTVCMPMCMALEIIIPIAFRLNTYCTHVFRRWLVEKALAKEKQQAYVMLIHKANGYC